MAMTKTFVSEPGCLVAALGDVPSGLAELFGAASYPGCKLDQITDLARKADRLVVVAATPLAVKALAPVIAAGKELSAVAVDELLSACVVLAGAHQEGNRMARMIEKRFGAKAVITTVSDLTDRPALDEMPGLVARGPKAVLQRQINNGAQLRVRSDEDLPLPGYLSNPQVQQPGSAVEIPISVRAEEGSRLVPKLLCVGIGLSSNATRADVMDAIQETFERARLDQAAIARVASLDRLRKRLDAIDLPWEIEFLPADRLSTIEVPNPSEAVTSAIGLPSVSEASALASAGPNSRLVVTKTKFARVTVAVAIPARIGKLNVVGIGPGPLDLIAPRTQAVIKRSHYIVGYHRYLTQISPLTTPSQFKLPYQLGEEIARVEKAIELATEGNVVSLVSSGDPGVYAMAQLAIELAPDTLELEVIPGISAHQAAASLLGAPFGHDHAIISLSDLLTPWEQIAKRIAKAASAGFAIAFYNPRSSRRKWQLDEALAIVAKHRPPSTPVALVRGAYRANQSISLCTLDSIDTEEVDMETTVVIGSDSTYFKNGKMVTPRGYKWSR
jgi:cobalt-precorrin 5A hydrolase/precorrin-3B C17-methyltransferase